MIRDIDHIQLAMPRGQEEAARAFYSALLGLQEIEKPDNLKTRGGVWFTLGQRQLHLGVEDGFAPARKAHPALLVDDLQELQTLLSTHGYPIMTDEQLPGYQRFYSNDPFGNRIEFLKKIAAD